LQEPSRYVSLLASQDGMATPSTSNGSARATNLKSSGTAFGRADLLALALLVGSVAALFWRLLFTSAMPYYRDVANYTYPSARYIHEICRHGLLPYWNPYLNYGQPLLANPNQLFFYPYTLLIVLLPVDFAYKLFYVAHFALAGIGTYLLARVWHQSRTAAFFAAFVFAFSGPLLSLGNVYNHAACAAWIPWALLATDRALEGRSLRPWILLTGIFSLQMLAGEPFTLIATFGLSFAYALYRRGTINPVWSKQNLWVLTRFFAVGSVMVALCAVQLLPSADLLSHSRRGVQGLRFRETANWAVNPLSLMEVAVPGFYGSATSSPTTWTWLVGDRNVPYFQSLFLGFVPLFFALAGWALGEDRRRNFVAGAAVAFLLLSFGHFTPVFSLAYLLAPLLMLVRYPIKLLVPVMFLTAILAGWGVDALRLEATRWKKRRNRIVVPLKTILVVVAGILTIAWLVPAAIKAPTEWALHSAGMEPQQIPKMAGFLLTMLRLQLPGLAGFTLGGLLLVLGSERKHPWARRGGIAFALLGLAQLAQVNYSANPTVPKSFYTYRPPVLSEFKGEPDTYRVTSLVPINIGPDSSNNLQSFVNFQSIPEARDLPSLAQGAFQAKIQLVIGSMFHHVEGSINLDLERSLPPYIYDLEIDLARQPSDTLSTDCLLGRTNVKYIIRPTRADSAATRLIGEVPNGSPQPSYLYEDLCFLPRAYVPGFSVFSTDSRTTLQRMASPEFKSRQTVILAAKPGTTPGVDDPSTPGRVQIVERHPGSVALRAELDRPGYVVLMDRYDPNWHASVDGREVRVLRANQLFRAVYADAGQHEIRFYYHQRGLMAGLIISLLTLGTLAGLYFRR
jgi:hypothetical protein